MEAFRLENVSFTYPGREKKAIDNISVSIQMGEFVTLCGCSGCGKTTLLRLLKPQIAPFGKTEGEILFENKQICECTVKEVASKIGFVMQNPDNQPVTDKVWHELAFGLESLGMPTAQIRTRVAETASFFGIQGWFHKKVSELSGGQKQLLNLASVALMQPSVIILDEPTSQLDPISAQNFLAVLKKINREIGTTVIIAEHTLDEVLPMSDHVIVMEDGKITSCGTPEAVCGQLADSDMYDSLPVPVRIFERVKNDLPCPMTVREGRIWLEEYSRENEIVLKKKNISPKEKCETAIKIRDVHFRYEKNDRDVLSGLNLEVKKGELFALVGGNGTGKSTALSVISGLLRPYRGSVTVKGRDVFKNDICGEGILGVLPQNPQNIFVKNSVYEELSDMIPEKIDAEEKNIRIEKVAHLCKIERFMNMHPYDLSGGEQQRAALAKVLLAEPEILLLDEPTKGIDGHFKKKLAAILGELIRKKVTILMVSHDLEFCAEVADRCAMLFDGAVTSVGNARNFFAGNNFYTTAANRMARQFIPEAVTADDVISACGGKIKETETTDEEEPIVFPKKDVKNVKFKKKIAGGINAVIFIILSVMISAFGERYTMFGSWPMRLLTAGFALTAIVCFLPESTGNAWNTKKNRNVKRTARSFLTAAVILVLIPFTIYFGTHFLGGRKYYFISLLVMLEAIVPFCLLFERRRPGAREIVIISTLSAIAVAGRSAFFMLPQFKPVVAIVIISGVCLGGEAGFLVGAITALVSNFFFGQGPWTVWQMFSFGVIGFLTGILSDIGIVGKNKINLSIFGFISTLVVYGGIMNPASIIMVQEKITWEMIVTAYAMGFPVDLVHAAATAFFLWIASDSMIEKLMRIKIKYGMADF